VSFSLARQEATRTAGLAVLLFAIVCACGIGGLEWMRRADELALQAVRAERAAAAHLMEAMLRQERTIAGAADKPQKARDEQVAEIYAIAAAEKLQVLGAEVEADPAQPTDYSVDVRLRGTYPGVKKLMAQVLEKDARAAVRNFSARRLASGAGLEMRVLFTISD
jgi:hypothetical protein